MLLISYTHWSGWQVRWSDKENWCFTVGVGRDAGIRWFLHLGLVNICFNTYQEP